jgi:hypothetical protein
VLCIIIVATTDTTPAPFENLTAADIVSCEVRTELGEVERSDSAFLSELTDALRVVVVKHASDEDFLPDATLTLYGTNGSSIEIEVSPQYLRLDGTMFTTDATHLSNLIVIADSAIV